VRFKELGKGAEMNCCGQLMFEGKDGDTTVMVCTGGCGHTVRLECPNCQSRLIPCIAGQSFFCLKCNDEFYWRGGKLVKGSEALREAQDDCKP
jgi:hypothetical protein